MSVRTCDVCVGHLVFGANEGFSGLRFEEVIRVIDLVAGISLEEFAPTHAPLVRWRSTTTY